MPLFKSRQVNELEKIQLLSLYVEKHQCSEIPFSLFLAAKTDFKKVLIEMLSNFLTSKEIDGVLQSQNCKEIIQDEDVTSLMELPSMIFNNPFCRDELSPSLITLNELVSSLIPVKASCSLEIEIIKQTNPAQFGMLKIRPSVFKTLTQHACNTMRPIDRVTMLYKTRTGKVVFFTDNHLLLLSDELSDKVLQEHKLLASKDDQFWRTPLFPNVLQISN